MIPVLDGPQPEPALNSFNADKVWYTNLNGSVGQVDPLTAGATAATVTPSPAAASPGCSNAGSGTAIDVSRRSGTLVWETADYPLLQDQDGWTIYDLPEDAAPWGLAASGDAVWLNDQGTPGQRAQKLVQLQFTVDPTPAHTPTTTPGPSETPTSTPTDGLPPHLLLRQQAR